MTKRRNAGDGCCRSRTLAASGEAGRALALADGLLASLSTGPDRAAVLVRRFKVEDDDLAFADLLLEEALVDAGRTKRCAAASSTCSPGSAGPAWQPEGRRSVRGGRYRDCRCTDDEPLRMLAQSSLALMGAFDRRTPPRSAGRIHRAGGLVRGSGNEREPAVDLGKLLFWRRSPGGAATVRRGLLGRGPRGERTHPAVPPLRSLTLGVRQREPVRGP